MLLPEKMTQLAIHLAEGGKTEEALTLIRKLLDRFTHEMQQSDAYANWRYDRIVEQLTPALAIYGGLPALTLLCEALLASLGERTRGDDAEQNTSSIWRPAIEDHSQNAPKGFRAAHNALVSAIRDVAERLIHDDAATTEQVVAVLERFHAPIFTRLIMHLLRLYPDRATDAVAKYLLTHEYFDLLGYRHEYALLSGIGFKLLAPQEQQAILSWIAATPAWASTEQADAEDTRAGGKQDEAAEARTEDELAYWRLERLTPFAQHLPPQWKAQYDALVQQYGVPEHPDFGMYFTAGWVDEAPGAISVDQLRAMSIAQLIEYLKTWTPSASWHGPSREGVGQLLVELIGPEPMSFARDAERFADLHPVYLAAMFQGFERALTQQLTFPWDAILRLMERCFEREVPKKEAQPRVPESAEGADTATEDTSGGDEAANRHEARTPSDSEASVSSSTRLDVSEIPSFVWVRSTIANLLERALKSQPVPIGPELRDVVWTVLRPLTSDVDPSPETEQRFGGDNMDPSSLAINSVRGVALHATILFARWSRLLDETTAQAEGDSASVGRSEMLAQDVSDVLNAHLNVALDPSLAVRSVYGQRFPLLAVLDPAWADEHIVAIFPSGEEQRRLWETAWDAYVLYNQPNRRTWALLHDEYGRAIDRLSAHTSPRKHLADSDVRTVEHLMELAWSDVIHIGEPGTLLERVYARASDQALGEAVSHVGLRVVSTAGRLDDTVRQHLQELWQWRMTTSLKHVAEVHQRELAAFGWWFGAGQFDTYWALDQLAGVLVLTSGRIEGTHLVLERLVELPEEALTKAVACLAQIAKGDRTEDFIDVWEPQIGAVFFAVNQRGDAEAKTSAVQLINQLVAHGHVSFRAYLPHLDTPPPQPIESE